MAKYIKTEEGYKTVEDIGVATVEMVETAQTTADGKMDATNPTGTGKLSFGSNISSTGVNSIAMGYGLQAKHKLTTVLGHNNVRDNSKYSTAGDYNWVDYSTRNILAGRDCYIGTGYSFDATTGLFKLINPTRVSVTATTVPDSSEFYGCLASDDPTALSYINFTEKVRWVTGSSGVYFEVKSMTATDVHNGKGKYALIVGNGTTYHDIGLIKNLYSNAHTLDWNGVGWYQGGLQVGGNAQDDGAKNVMLEGNAYDYFILNDVSTGTPYKIQIIDGNLVSSAMTSETESTT